MCHNGLQQKFITFQHVWIVVGFFAFFSKFLKFLRESGEKKRNLDLLPKKWQIQLFANNFRVHRLSEVYEWLIYMIIKKNSISNEAAHVIYLHHTFLLYNPHVSTVKTAPAYIQTV